MAIRIVDEQCRVEGGKLVVVIEGDGPEEVLGNQAKYMALQKAGSCGYQRIGVNGQSGSYPVDSEGRAYEDQNQQAKDGLIAAYRNEIVLMGGL